MLFFIAIIIDIIMLLIALYETFMVSSNSSWGKPALLLFGLICAGFWFRSTHPTLALVLVGLPAAAATLFVVVLLFTLITGNGRWQ